MSYDYELPAELIAQHPLRNRADARLMVIDRATDEIHHSHIRDLPDWLKPADRLVLNDTRVLPARLVGYRSATRGRWTGLFLSSSPEGIWKVLGKTRGKLAPNETITLQSHDSQDDVRLRLLARLEGGVWAMSPEPAEAALDVLRRVGRVPLPPYIRGGKMEEADRERYQTVFARRDGAVAAPTAGLHFTDTLLARLADRGVARSSVTLHIGVGTFRPMTTPVDEHQMHAEWGELPEQTSSALRETRRAGGRIVAVGTTVVRVLESAAAAHPQDPLEPWSDDTSLFIKPGHSFQCTDLLLTNFHLPKSSLLVLVRTFGGDALLRRAYEEAIADRYRFFSYGDAMLIR
ncbi:MAG: tRNA preQ1(34) S-adenosylmethionine ribosyltransferase-isomerase QueA [Pirellulaceae bacterium]|nr:tRNA preQ1(34) S-adenosylmethionine ribosyltransferase-isomerase QueA [Pirellulaceae bacterium]